MSRHSARSRRYRDLRAAFLRVNTTCWLCEREIDPTLKWPHPYSESIDHLIATSRYEVDPCDTDYWRAAHLRCNNQRQAKAGRVRVGPTTRERARRAKYEDPPTSAPRTRPERDW